MVHDAVLLRHLDALQPLGEVARDVLLPERLPPDARRIALHGNGPALQVGEHHRRDGLVVGRELALGDAIFREEDLVRVGDHRYGITSCTRAPAPACRGAAWRTATHFASSLLPAR